MTDINLIDHKLLNKMDEKDQKSFDEKVLFDSKFKAQYDLTYDIFNALKDDDTIKLRNQLDNIYNSSFKTSKTLKISTQFIRTAAAILLITLSFISYLTINKPVNTQEIFANNYTTYETIMLVRSLNHSQDNVSNAMSLYNNKLYKAAIDVFNKVLAEDNTLVNVQFYYGVSNIETENYEKAIESFNIIKSSNNKAFIEQAEWYLALCYIKTNNIELAKTELENISKNNTSYYNNKALKVLKQLKRLQN